MKELHGKPVEFVPKNVGTNHGGVPPRLSHC